MNISALIPIYDNVFYCIAGFVAVACVWMFLANATHKLLFTDKFDSVEEPQ